MKKCISVAMVFGLLWMPLAATAELKEGFLSFFMELINSRIQWTNRGTVITTNLQNDQINALLGDALSDRILTGQIFEFEGPSRRMPVIL